MISSLENGPTEEDLELLLGGGGEEEEKAGGEKEEQILFVDLRGEPDDLRMTDNRENSNWQNKEFRLRKAACEQGRDELDRQKRHKATREKKKEPRSKRKKSRQKDDLDSISIDSDDFVVPDDEVIPPDWEYNFEEPIVCQNATFYNKVDSILTRKVEDPSDNEEETSQGGDLMDASVIAQSKANEGGGFQAGMNGIDLDKEYIDDKDNTVLIVESHLLGDEPEYDDDEDAVEQATRAREDLNSFLIKRPARDAVAAREMKARGSEPMADKSVDSALDERILKLEILNLCFNVTQKALKVFEGNTDSQTHIENSLKLQNDEMACLLILFKSIDIEFCNLFNKKNTDGTHYKTGTGFIDSMKLIQSYLDLFYKSILNSLDTGGAKSGCGRVDLDFLKELHSEMMVFLESRFEEKFKELTSSSQFNDFALFFFFLKVLGLTLLVEHLLIQTIRTKKSQEGDLPSKLQCGRFPQAFFSKENLLNKSQVSKILRRVLRRVLDNLLEWVFKQVLGDAEMMEDLQFILVLAIFMNCKVSGDLVFTFISESHSKHKGSNFSAFLTHYFAMIAYSNVTDSKFDISKLFPKFIFDLKSYPHKKDSLGHYFLLNEYLKSVSIYQLNNMACGNKFESLLYRLSDSKFLYNISNESHQVNVCLLLFGNSSSPGAFLSKVDASKLRMTRNHLGAFEEKLNRVLFLGPGREGADCLTEEKEAGASLAPACTKGEVDLLELTEEIYVSLLRLLVNLVDNPKEFCLLLKFIKSNFEFDKAENSISKTDIIMHYITYNSLFLSLLEMDSRNNLDALAVLSLYNSYSDENDQINNFLLTEMVLNDSGDSSSDDDFSERIKLNRNYKLLIQTCLGSSKFGPHFEKEFHLEILDSITSLTDSFPQDNPSPDCPKHNNKPKLKELLHFEHNKTLKTKNAPNIHPLKTCELILYSNLISTFNSNVFFANVINTGTRFFLNACGNNNVDKKKKLVDGDDELVVRVLICFKKVVEEILDVYVISIAEVSDGEFGGRRTRSGSVGGIFSLVNNLAILLFEYLLEFGSSLACDLLRYYFGQVSEKLIYYVKRFEGKKVSEPLVFHSYRAFSEFVLRFAHVFSGSAEMRLEAFSYMVVLYLVMFNVKHNELKSYYREYLGLERRVFEQMGIPSLQAPRTSQMSSGKKVTGKLSGSHLVDFYFKQNICKRLNSLYNYLGLFGTIGDLWKAKMTCILDFTEFSLDTSRENKHRFNQTQAELNINDLILELYFDYFTYSLDGDALQIVNKKLVANCLNLYSSSCIFGLLLNIILRGVNEKGRASREELVLNWSHVNNSIKGYINQVNDESLVGIWVNHNFIHMFMVPSSFSCKFINVRIHFWTNILSIPLSKVLLNPDQDFLKVKTTLEFPLNYLKRLLVFKDLDTVRENLLDFSINFVIDSVRLIHLSYFKIILKMLVFKVQRTEDPSSLQLQELVQFTLKLLTYMTLLSQKLATEVEQDIDCPSSASKANNDTKRDVLDNISLLSQYLHEVSKTVHELLTTREPSVQGGFDTHAHFLSSSSGHEILRKKTEWVNHFIYSSRSDHSEHQAKFNILEYIFKTDNAQPLSTEFQKLAQIFHRLRRKSSCQISLKSSPFCTPLTPASPSCSFSKVSLQLFEDICIHSKLKKNL